MFEAVMVMSVNLALTYGYLVNTSLIYTYFGDYLALKDDNEGKSSLSYDSYYSIHLESLFCFHKLFFFLLSYYV